MTLEPALTFTAPARHGVLYRRRRTLTAAAIIIACAGSATVGLVKAMGPHGPFRTVSNHPHAAAPIPDARSISVTPAEDAKPIAAEYRAPDREEVSRAYLNVSAVYKNEGLSGVVRQTMDCFSGLKSNPSYAALDYCVALDIYGAALQSKLADGEPIPQDAYFAGLAPRDLAVARGVVARDGDAGARLLDIRRLAGEVSQAGPQVATETVRRAAVANALALEQAAQKQAEQQRLQLATAQQQAILAAASHPRAPTAVSTPAPARPAPPTQLAATPKPAPAPIKTVVSRPALVAVAQAQAQAQAQARPALPRPTPVAVARPHLVLAAPAVVRAAPVLASRAHVAPVHAAPPRPAPVTHVAVKVAPRIAPKLAPKLAPVKVALKAAPKAQVQAQVQAQAQGPARGAKPKAPLVVKVSAKPRSTRRPVATRAVVTHAPSVRSSRKPMRVAESRPRLTKASQVRTASAKAAPRPRPVVVAARQPTRSSLPRPLQALDRFFRRVTHREPAQAQTQTRVQAQAQARAPSHPWRAAPMRTAADRRASEPGSWIDCRRPRSTQEARICQGEGSNDGTLGGQLRQATRSGHARSVEDPG